MRFAHGQKRLLLVLWSQPVEFLEVFARPITRHIHLQVDVVPLRSLLQTFLLVTPM